MTVILSICIPTYNRKSFLENCLNSILKSAINYGNQVEICVSDNHSTDGTEFIVNKYSAILNLKTSRNSKNLGSSANILKAVSMARGEYVWIIGDDDLILPGAVEYFFNSVNKYGNLDFYFINAYTLNNKNAPDQMGGIDLNCVPKDLSKFSQLKTSFKCNFFDLINPEVSFDFLGGIYLSIFKRGLWEQHLHVINYDYLISHSHLEIFETTFPHIKIYASAFRDSRALFIHEPLLVSLSGGQEWAPSWPLVKSIRIIEALKCYRNSGMNFFQYLKCMNFAHNTFASDYIKMVLNPVATGGNYANLTKSIAIAVIFPGFYISILKSSMNICRKYLIKLIKYQGY